ncbi:MAG: hypothetical protein QF724_10835 [Planctomycetota bacterium]|jgi:hypothetical protein|nr:hypothetical protein [Planctomycetota bacterium]MDP6519547.1 hypothetical protein [Planctomycetota bacterium]MDP6839422.1 hypothetical protein [Planctomycetota bacterium]MDP6955365.1 hypothetical protein [Planctomycetota bacterium]
MAASPDKHKGHWSKERSGLHGEAQEHYRRRSAAPGVAEGGGPRSHYCLECDGLLPLEYDRRLPAAVELKACPHCGATLDPRLRAMFNWVETDQVPASDFKALLPYLVIGTLISFALLALLLALL